VATTPELLTPDAAPGHSSATASVTAQCAIARQGEVELRSSGAVETASVPAVADGLAP
jgi:hypothetical protein